MLDIFCNARMDRDAALRAVLLFVSFLERAKHDVNIDISFFRMLKSARQGTDDVKPKPLPETNGCFIRRDNKIELHRAKAKSLRLAQTMLAHLSAYSKSARLRRNHEGGIRNVRTGCGLIRV